MTKYIDSNIPIECPECTYLDWDSEIGCSYGIQAMTVHYLTVHQDKYPTLREAAAMAEVAMENAYDVQDIEEAAYHDNQKLVRSLRRNGGED